MKSYDYVIVGSGIAGLYAALLAREHGDVLLVTKGALDDTNTKLAQGGIAAAIGAGDSPAEHLRDTIAAGAGLVDERAARILVEEAPARIADLVRYGVPFDTLHGELALGREAAHGHARVLHAGGDRTGAHIELTLGELARRQVRVLEHRLVECIVIDGGRAAGIETIATVGEPKRERVACRHLVLATGGAGQLYGVTTNTALATGDGMALAYEAGAELADMEFIQFHPTALRLPGVPPFLISEAVRGEGAVLRAPDGRPFMREEHEAADLAPRDVVARAIAREMRRAGTSHVLLDTTHLDAETLAARFPQIYRRCLDHGLDIAKDPIPVAPAAHYVMGGVRTDTWGRTTVRDLYACGEVACTGVHGANRLASNSLLETVVFAQRAVEASIGAAGGGWPKPSPEAVDLPPADPSRAEPPRRETIQALMWEKVGIEREGEGLAAAAGRLAGFAAALPEADDTGSHELRSLLRTARLVAAAAVRRTESRGAHFRSDYPVPDRRWLRRLVFRAGAAM